MPDGVVDFRDLLFGQLRRAGQRLTAQVPQQVVYLGGQGVGVIHTWHLNWGLFIRPHNEAMRPQVGAQRFLVLALQPSHEVAPEDARGVLCRLRLHHPVNLIKQII